MEAFNGLRMRPRTALHTREHNRRLWDPMTSALGRSAGSNPAESIGRLLRRSSAPTSPGFHGPGRYGVFSLTVSAGCGPKVMVYMRVSPSPIKA